jgi:hypothetical protein
MNSVIGFNNTDTVSTTAHQGSNAYDLSHPRYLYINIDELHSRNSTSNISDHFEFLIPVTGNRGDLIIFNSNDAFEQEVEVPPTKLSTLTVQITARRTGGNLNDLLNGADWGFVIALE